jgi:hypothetical protein
MAVEMVRDGSAPSSIRVKKSSLEWISRLEKSPALKRAMAVAHVSNASAMGTFPGPSHMFLTRSVVKLETAPKLSITEYA